MVRDAYAVLDEAGLRATRRSDTVYILGSGASVNEIPPGELEALGEADTLAFNWFVRCRGVRVGYHLVREIAQYDARPLRWRRELAEFGTCVRTNPRYDGTVFLVQGGYRAVNGNRLIARRELRRGTRLFRWRTATGRERLGSSFADGLTHAGATLDECVNLAVLLGWRRIVLVGVDLYDRRYFWLGPDEALPSDRTRGATPDMRHATATRGMIERYGRWHGELARSGVSLEVWNPRSLLAEVLPVASRMAP